MLGSDIQASQYEDGWIYQVSSRVCEVKQIKKDYTITALKDYSSTERLLPRAWLTDYAKVRKGLLKEDYTDRLLKED